MEIHKDQPVVTSANLCLKTLKETLHVLSGKWKIQIIALLLENGRTRFMDIQRGVTGISCKVLSKELQQMERDGIIVRLVSDPKLTIVEYELTRHGYTLKSLLLCITSWGAEHSKIAATT
ncbi:helix-turn-helix transcriptional regulator [Chryseobacterium indologenes]|uniref:winged helix-turn-helix transcriptional regulator n=1 Tax=Chryseobacterium indologenes TaxID=253 RepID=UPI001108AD0F|nr:helix-turn-helix domain-containing protein [Chryseobacterium indologenes]TLX26616.1 helix-turn-helix transcriptional regulator [Chryseobacterium indologenes]